MNRRSWIQTAMAGTAALAAGGATRATAAADESGEAPAPSAKGRPVKLGIVGCGGRGMFLADLITEHTSAVVSATHDFFADRAERMGDKHGAPAGRRFSGLDGYKALLETDVEAVVLSEPPYYRPDHFVAAADAGKHILAAKPLAVDIPGCRAIAAAAQRAGAKRSLWVDFQTRADPIYQGAAERVHRGVLGKIVTAQIHYQNGPLYPRAEPDGSPVARLRNWVFDKVLSGDIIVEQNIHVIDVGNWLLQAEPIRAMGGGGRMARVNVGDCWDTFSLTYEYPNGVFASFSSTQCIQGFGDLCVRVLGSEGTVDTHYGNWVRIRGNIEGWRGGRTSQIYRNGARDNGIAFVRSILQDAPIQNIDAALGSTRASILGREAAYRGGEKTMAELEREASTLDPKLELPPNAPSFKTLD